MRSCHFAGAAAHTALGADLDTAVAALLERPTAATLLPVQVGAASLELPYRLLAGLPLDRSGARLHAVAGAVATTALEAAGLSADERRRCGLFLGSSSFDIGATEAAFAAGLQQDSQTLAMARGSSIGVLAHDLAGMLGLAGCSFSFSTACTGSANALLYANAMIRAGLLDEALVLGVETFNLLTSLGFSGLQLLGTGGMQPFSRGRSGIVLGEGCSALVLSHRQRSDSAWRIVAGANRCDTYGMSTANPDGGSVADVIRQALGAASLSPEHITAIKTHGTATPSGDEAEAAGLRRVFRQLPPLTALKPFIGHTLGACGLNELLLFCGAIDRGFMAATPGIGHDDPQLGVQLIQSPLPASNGCYLLNYFGFGGNNTVLIVTNQTGMPT